MGHISLYQSATNTNDKSHNLLLLLAGLQAFGPISIDLILPALPQISSDLSIRSADSQLTVSVFLAGLSIGMLVYGPLSDRFGRRRLLLGGILLYIMASLLCALSETPEQLLSFRFLQALGASAASVLGRAIVRDLYTLTRAARALSLMHLVSMLAAMLSPLLGSYLLLVGSWRILFLMLAVFSLILFLFSYLKLAETLSEKSRQKSISNVFSAYLIISSNKRAVGLILCTALCYAGMFAYIAGSPIVFIEYFHLSPQLYSWMFFFNICGICILVLINTRLVGNIGIDQLLKFTMRLCLVTSVVLICSSLVQPVSIWLTMSGLFLYVSCTGVVSTNCLAVLMNYFPDNSGAASGLTIAMQFGLGALASMILSFITDGSPVYMTSIVALCGLLSFLAMYLTQNKRQPAFS